MKLSWRRYKVVILRAKNVLMKNILSVKKDFSGVRK